MAPAKGPPSKDAVVFILDANPSMNKPYPASAQNTGCTRLSCAKEALEDMVSQLMINSKANEVAVVVLKTERTSHHMMNEDEDDGEEPFPNLTELPESGLSRPNAQLLRDIRTIEASTPDVAGGLRGDILDGLLVGTDALYQKTFGKRYRRKMIIFTDAEHPFVRDKEQLARMFYSLKTLECQVKVVGLDFVYEAEFNNETIPHSEPVKVEPPTVDGPPPGVKLQNELFLVSLVKNLKEFGGVVRKASTLREIVGATMGDRPTASQRKHVELHIAPGLMIPARYITLLKKENFPSLKTGYATLDSELKWERNGAGEIMSGRIEKISSQMDPENKAVVIPSEKIADAFIFGSDYVPMSAMDFVGLKENTDSVSIKIIGYAAIDNIRRSHMVGPAYGITGHDSQRACAAVAALAEGLHRRRQVAICGFTRTKNGDPVLGALFPLLEKAGAKPRRLFFVQLPFEDDVQVLPARYLDAFLCDDDIAKRCDDLIDALTLPDCVLQSEKIADPSKRSFYKTVKDRVADRSSTRILTGRLSGLEDPMATPADVLERAADALHAFHDMFPLEKVEESKAADGKKHQNYFMNHDEVQVEIASDDAKRTAAEM